MHHDLDTFIEDFFVTGRKPRPPVLLVAGVQHLGVDDSTAGERIHMLEGAHIAPRVVENDGAALKDALHPGLHALSRLRTVDAFQLFVADTESLGRDPLQCSRFVWVVGEDIEDDIIARVDDGDASNALNPCGLTFREPGLELDVQSKCFAGAEQVPARSRLRATDRLLVEALDDSHACVGGTRYQCTAKD